MVERPAPWDILLRRDKRVGEGVTERPPQPPVRPAGTVRAFCRGCGDAMWVSEVGRPRVWCSQACRQRAYRQRRARRR